MFWPWEIVERDHDLPGVRRGRAAQHLRRRDDYLRSGRALLGWTILVGRTA